MIVSQCVAQWSEIIVCFAEIRMSVAKVTPSSLAPVLSGRIQAVRMSLLLSGVTDQTIEAACRVAEALQCEGG